MVNKIKNLYQFVSVNLLMLVISFLAYRLNLVIGLGDLPTSEYIMMGFLAILWFIGIIFILRKQWQNVYFIANSIPMWALICLGINIYDSLASAHEVSADVAFGVVKAAGLGILINSFGIFLMVWLKKLTYFISGEHI